jgi:hypothetical protein
MGFGWNNYQNRNFLFATCVCICVYALVDMEKYNGG